jgi:hypothetical protein
MNTSLFIYAKKRTDRRGLDYFKDLCDQIKMSRITANDFFSWFSEYHESQLKCIFAKYHVSQVDPI